MGGPNLKVLTEWSDCARCQRRLNRIGVFAPEWPNNSPDVATRIVVLVANVSRASQASKCLEPALIDIATEITTRLGLPDGSVLVDHLVACGLGLPNADAVAACSSRFRQQDAPTNIVLLGMDAIRLADEAGLLLNGTFDVIGNSWKVPVENAGSIDEAVALLSARLGIPDRGSPTGPIRNVDVTTAKTLFAILGRFTGHQVLHPNARDWKKYKRDPLDDGRVLNHLLGSIHFGAFHPRGDWGFVVIDIDRHNAIQESYFQDTLRDIKNHFPDSIEVVSSSSGGRHFYVKLPDGTHYEEGALILQAFFAFNKLMWRDVGAGSPVRAQLIEVLVEPTRLPLGNGSSFPGDNRPIADQVLDFVRRLHNAPHDDFLNAKNVVFKERSMKGKWSWRKQEKLQRYIERKEVAALREPDPNDEWYPIIKDFPNALRRVAGNGIPAHGTRTKWMRKLAHQFGETMSAEEATTLLIRWLKEKIHASEDVVTDPEQVIRDAVTWARKEHPGGVPVRVWQRVRRLVKWTYLLTQDPNRRVEVEKAKPLSEPQRLVLDNLLRTAFEVLRGFYKAKVRKRQIHHKHFARYAYGARGKDIELVLTYIGGGKRGWLVSSGFYVPDVTSRTFALLPGAWPLRPGEPMQYVP